jgi:hypothetical protein
MARSRRTTRAAHPTVRAILDGAADELCRGHAVYLHGLGVNAGQCTALERRGPFGELRSRLR